MPCHSEPMTARDAIEVVRKAQTALSDLGACDDALCPESNCLHVLPHMDEAIETLQALVERAGEPVAWREVVRATGRVRSHIDWQPTADMIEASDMEEADWQPLYYIPPTAPGASHE